MPALKTLLFTVVVPGTVTVLLPYWFLSSEPTVFTTQLGVVRYLGLLPILLGASIYLWCAWDFAATGKGTPAPIDPPKQLIVRGLYRWVRNPMYVGVLLILLGEALFFASPTLVAYPAAIFGVFHIFVILYEEPTLRGKFGDPYQRYCNSVPRWIPRKP